MWEVIQLGSTSGKPFSNKHLYGKSSSCETLQGEHFLINTCTGNKISGKLSSGDTLQGRIIFLETLVREIN
jgi:hypothetical protein